MAKQRYYGTRDICEILGCGMTMATQIMHMFEYRGKMVRIGRLLKVKITDFEAWLEEKEENG